MAADDDGMINHLVVSHDDWLEARRALLEKEKAFTRQCDDMSRLQRSLPWERVTTTRPGARIARCAPTPLPASLSICVIAT